MTMLIVLVLCAVAARLWYDVRALRERLAVLEFGGAAMPFERAVFGTPLTAAPEPAVAPSASAPEPPVRPVPIPVQRPAPVPLPPVAEPERAEAQPRSGFENVFGRRLPIWAGGVTLAVAGFLIVRYSIEAGLLSPAVRVVFGLIFGTALIAGAEAALRGHVVVQDLRVRQALAGAGIATWYAAILAAAELYGLVGPGAAFVGMALVTAAAGALSIRFGAPSALLGLVGGLAAPALVGAGPPDVPLLAAYLALAVGGLCALARGQRWWWLGAAALVGGFGWGLALILGGTLDLAGALSVGLYTLLLGVGLPLLLLGERAQVVRLAGGVAGAAQMAALVATGGFAPLHWGLFGLLSVALVWLPRREATLRELPALGLGVALLLGFAWPDPSAGALALMLAVTAAIYGGAAAWRLWRAPGRTDAGQLAAITAAIGVLPVLHFLPALPAWPALIGAALAAGIAASGWRAADRREDVRFATLAIASAALLSFAALLALEEWLSPPALACVALGLLLLGERAGDRRIVRGFWAFAGLCIVVLIAKSAEIERALGLGTDFDTLLLVRWLVPTAVAAIFARRAALATVAEPAAVLLGYVAAAQVVPVAWLPLVPALLLAGQRRLPAIATAGALALGWAAWPLIGWFTGAGGALLGEPFYATALPSLGDVVLRLALPAAALATALLRADLPERMRQAGRMVVTLLAAIAAHVLYKQLFALDDWLAFVRQGYAERTLWQMLLAVAAAALWSRRRDIATAFGAASVLHFAWFSVLLHNPLWTEQAVGPWLLPAYATAFLLVRTGAGGWAREWPSMALIALFAFSALRQAAHGSMPLWLGAGAEEDIARSVLAVALAVRFLRYGIAKGLRDWRIASLVLMLLAVAKVFLFDAAGLDGLLRIASFAALGFSLIGVGWLYSRHLPDPASVR